MVPLILANVALGGELVAHAGASFGFQYVPGLTPPPNNLARLELGLGNGRVQGYGVASLAAHRGSPRENAVADGEPPATVGHGRLSCVGAGARVPFDRGWFRLVPHVEVGLAIWDSPMDEAAYRNEVVPEVGEVAAGLHSVGPWAQGGLDFGFEVVRDTVVFSISPDVAFVGIPGLWLAVGPRVGFSAAF